MTVLTVNRHFLGQKIYFQPYRSTNVSRVAVGLIEIVRREDKFFFPVLNIFDLLDLSAASTEFALFIPLSTAPDDCFLR